MGATPAFNGLNMFHVVKNQVTITNHTKMHRLNNLYKLIIDIVLNGNFKIGNNVNETRRCFYCLQILYFL